MSQEEKLRSQLREVNQQILVEKGKFCTILEKSQQKCNDFMFKAIIGNSAPQLQPEKVEDKEFSNEKRDLEIRIEKLENTIGNKIKKIQQIEKKEEEKEEIIKELTNRELKLLALNEVLKDSIKRKKEKIEELISSQIQNKLNIEKMNEELNKIREKYEELEKKYQTMLEEFVVPLRTKSDSFSEFNFCSPPPTKIPETDHRNNDNQIMESGQSGINGDQMQKFEINLNSENFEIFLEENNFEKLLNEIEKIKKEKLNFLNEKEELKKITEQQNEKNQKISQENHELLEEKENFLFKIDNLTRELKKIQENYTNLSTKFILTKEKQKSLKQHLKNEIQKKEVAEKSVLALKKQKETSNSAPVEKKVSFNVSPASHSPLLPENIKKFQKINPNSPNPPNTGRELSSAVGGSAATLLTSSMLHKRGRDVATAGKGADSNSPPKKKALKNGKYVISISGFKPNDKEFNSLFKSKLLKIINTLNGSFVENMDSSVTHVVTPPNCRTIKTLAGALISAWIVHPNWLLESAAASKFIEEERFGVRYTVNPIKSKVFYLAAGFRKDAQRVTVCTQLIVEFGNGKITQNIGEADYVIVSSAEDSQYPVTSLTWQRFMDLIPGSEESASPKQPSPPKSKKKYLF